MENRQTHLPSEGDRYYPLNMEILRESILYDKHNRLIPASQVMPKYIPKEPTKACVSSPLLSSGAPSRSLVSSRHGSTFFSEMDSDSCSVRTQSTINTTREKSVMSYTSRSNRQPTKRHRHRKHKKGTESKAKLRPVNIVGPIVSEQALNSPGSEIPNSEDREELFSVSGADESGESLAEGEGEGIISSHQGLREEVLAQKKLISKLEHDLSSQIKVNGDLKKLLVASVGNDLEYKVEKLAQDKAHLAATVGSYSEKLYQDVEDLDRVSIQADMWKSKYMASRVQAEELSDSQLMLTQRYTEAAAALQAMIQERQNVNNNLHTAHKLLQSLSNTAYSPEVTAQTTTLYLSKCLLSICNNLVKGDNLESLHQGAAERSTKGFSEAEAQAYHVLSDQLLLPQKIIEIPQTEEIPRNTKSFFCISTPLLLTGGGRGGAMTSHPNNCVCKQCANTVI